MEFVVVLFLFCMILTLYFCYHGFDIFTNLYEVLVKDALPFIP